MKIKKLGTIQKPSLGWVFGSPILRGWLNGDRFAADLWAIAGYQGSSFAWTSEGRVRLSERDRILLLSA